MANGLHGKNLAQSETLCTWRRSFFARNLGRLIHARTRVPGRLGNATSRTPSMYVDEKSDEAIVLAKRLNRGRQLPAETRGGKGLIQGEQPLGGRGSDPEPKYRVDPNNGCASDGATLNRSSYDDGPEGGARCLSSARRDLCGGEEKSSSLPRPLLSGWRRGLAFSPCQICSLRSDWVDPAWHSGMSAEIKHKNWGGING
jgi:hypothetical protein